MLKNITEGYKPQVDWGAVTVDSALDRIPAWQKKLLYTLLAGLLLLAVANFLTTLWLLSRVNFNTEGLGSLQVEVGGLHIEGGAWLGDTTNTAKIQSRKGETVKLIGYHNLSLIGVDDNMNAETAILLDTRNVDIYSSSFSVSDQNREEIFYTEPDGARVDTEVFILTGGDGAIFEGSTQTPNLLAHPNKPLNLLSTTRDISMSANKDLSIEARDHDVTAFCREDLTLQTEEGMIRFLTAKIYLPDLEVPEEKSFAPVDVVTTQKPESQIPPPVQNVAANTTPMPSTGGSDNGDLDEISLYQVCVCPSGRLFLADADSFCIPDANTCR